MDGNIINYVITVLGSLGGWEFLRWMLTRKSNKRIAAAKAKIEEANADQEEAHADKEEFSVLRETIEFLQKQVYDKETRFAEQTAVVRKQNEDIITLMKDKAQLELELAMKRCNVKKCPKREPQNGY